MKKTVSPMKVALIPTDSESASMSDGRSERVKLMTPVNKVEYIKIVERRLKQIPRTSMNFVENGTEEKKENEIKIKTEV